VTLWRCQIVGLATDVKTLLVAKIPWKTVSHFPMATKTLKTSTGEQAAKYFRLLRMHNSTELFFLVLLYE